MAINEDIGDDDENQTGQSDEIDSQSVGHANGLAVIWKDGHRDEEKEENEPLNTTGHVPREEIGGEFHLAIGDPHDEPQPRKSDQEEHHG